MRRRLIPIALFFSLGSPWAWSEEVPLGFFQDAHERQQGSRTGLPVHACACQGSKMAGPG